MNLATLTDRDLLTSTKRLVKIERDVLTKILHHLREVERRRVYANLGFGSLFEYATLELNYSEGQACRRISAMRLIKEIPEVEEKIATGKLSLCNISKAQSFFRTANQNSSEKALNKDDKLEVLNKLENKSVREGEKALLSLQPDAALPKDRERAVTETHSQISFVMDSSLKVELEQVRSLLGSKGANMTFAELFSEMSKLSVAALKAKKFGKKRSKEQPQTKAAEVGSEKDKALPATSKAGAKKNEMLPTTLGAGVRKDEMLPTTLGVENTKRSKNPRYISQSMKHHVWRRDEGKCTNCGSTRHLNYDHIVPVAKGGETTAENLRLLCFGCNQRAAMNVFGVEKMRNVGT